MVVLILPAITVRLPWAAALRCGVKPVENRGKRMPPQYLGQKVAIHASAAWDLSGSLDPLIRNWWWGYPDRGQLSATDFSAMFRRVVAVGTLADSHQAVTKDGVTCCAPWGQPFHRDKVAWHYVFTDMVPLIEPVLARGCLLLPWQLPADASEEVHRQLLLAPLAGSRP